ncbi:MAG: cytochrome c biogenesis CcdA family protein [Sphingomonadaceae bacterium]
MDSQNLSLLAAFAAGLLSFLSPCVLPLVPAYVGYLAGNSSVAAPESRRMATLFHSAAFVLGFSLVFVGFWASIGLIGYVLPGFGGLFRQAGGAVLVILGLHQMGVFQISLLYRQFRLEPRLDSSATPLASMLVGVAFAAGWTPCIGPVLAGIIGLASMSETVAQGSYLLVAYSLGLGVPFLITGVALAQASALLSKVKRHLRVVSVASGLLLVSIGVMMLSDTFKLLPQYFNWGGL